MIQHDIFCGEKVRLVAADAEQMSTLFTRSERDSEFSRLLDSSPARLHSKKATKKWIEEGQEKAQPNQFEFLIRTLENDRLIGGIGLEIPHWSHADAFVGMGIGERDAQNKGYGSDALRVVLRFAFTELNLRRITLNVFEYNPRAIRVYEKVGFQHEGRARGLLNRDGKRYDMLYMGILREEWLEKYAAQLD